MFVNHFNKNFPYGIARNKDDKWLAFNRENKPIKHNSPLAGRTDIPVYTKHAKLDEKLLLELADDESCIIRSRQGKIIKIFLYTEATHPLDQLASNPDLWFNYFNKLKKISEIKDDFLNLGY